MRKEFVVQMRRGVAGSVLTLAGLFGVMPAVSAGSLPERVQATYDIEFNGFNIGTYEFTSTQDGTNYKLNGRAALSLMLGAFQWTGVTQSSGRIAGEGQKPAGFDFQYESSVKSGSTRIAFQGDTVSQVLHQPPSPPRDDAVPVQAQHLKGVLDPMTAVLALARGEGDPCNRRLPIYDGKQRFDLILSPKGQVPIAGGRGVEPAMGIACRVQYRPIAGHKADKETQHLSASNGIEIIMRPVAGAGIAIPYKITVPTMAGPATLISRRVVLTQQGEQRLAFAQ